MLQPPETLNNISNNTNMSPSSVGEDSVDFLSLSDLDLLPSLINLAVPFTCSYMSQPQFDPSHDWLHVQRVTNLARKIARAENERRVSVLSSNKLQDREDDDRRLLNLDVVTLCALLHDVEDSKYAPTTQSSSNGKPVSPLRQFLTSPPNSQVGLSPNSSLLSYILLLLSHVSYSTETKRLPKDPSDPNSIWGVLRRCPELGPVQDADRLDALGAIGIGRCFTYGANAPALVGSISDTGITLNGGYQPPPRERGRPFSLTIAHFPEKLELLLGLLKTPSGRKMGEEHGKRVKMFREWWEEEMNFAGNGIPNASEEMMDKMRMEDEELWSH